MKNTAAKLVLKAMGDKAGEDFCKKLTDFVIERVDDVLGEMADYRAVREKVERWMAGNFSDRETRETHNIFRLSNRSLRVVKADVAFLVARTVEDLFGTKPWFAVAPEGDSDGPLAQRIGKHAEWKLRLADFENVGEQAVERCFNLGEAIFRTGWRKKVLKYSALKMVLCSGPADAPEPVVTAAGEYIYEGDEMGEEGPAAVEGEGQMDVMDGMDTMDAAAPMDAPAAPGRAIYTKAPDVVIEDGMRFCEVLVDEEEIAYDGLDPQQIDWRNFRCPTSYDCIEDSPFRGHVYERRLSDLISILEQFHGMPLEKMDAETQEMVDKLRAEDTTAKDGARVAASAGDAGDDKNPVIECLDFEFEWDPEGKGNTRWFWGTVLVDSVQLFFVDFLPNVMPGGASLYTAVPVHKQMNRWHGRSEWENYEDVQTEIDRLWNLILHRENMIANPPTGMNPDAIEENIEDVKRGWGRPGLVVTLKPQKRMTDFLDFAVFPNTSGETWSILDKLMAAHQLEGGVSSSAQGSVGDLPQTTTATGIQSVLASGSTLHKKPAKDIRDGLQVVVEKNLAVLYTQQDKAETFTYGEGDNAELVTLTPEDVRDLKMNVRILMTRFRNRELVESARTAIGVHTQYLALPEDEKGAARPLYTQLLKGLDVPNAENVIREPREPVPPPGPSPLESVKVGYADMPVEAQAQLLTMLGFQGITPEMIAAKAESEKQDEKAEGQAAAKKEAA